MKLNKQYLIYHARWQLSTLVMLPFMIGLETLGLPLWLNLAVGQFIGACIFFYIDKRIFKEHKQDNIEEAIYKCEPRIESEIKVSDRKL